MKAIFYGLSILCIASYSIADVVEDVVEEVVVTGVQPGPKLWKVSKGEHELWILGTVQHLPKRLQWDSQSVEAILADADELIKPPGVSVKLDSGFFSKVLLAPSLIGLKKNPNKETLSDVLPDPLYQRWTAQKKRFLGRRRSVEKYRPFFAADALYNKALKKAGLQYNKPIWSLIKKAVKKHHIRVTGTSIRHTIEQPRALIKRFKRSQFDDIACMDATLTRLESGLEVMKQRASAWAEGDIATLKSLPYHDHFDICSRVIMSSPEGQTLKLTNVKARLKQRWLTAAKRALERNRVSFAVLPMQTLLEMEGLHAALIKEGYEIRVPQ